MSLMELRDYEDRIGLVREATDEELARWGHEFATSELGTKWYSSFTAHLAAELARRLGDRIKSEREPSCDRSKRKAWFHIRGGKKLYYEDPKPEDMPVLELIQAVACERRFSNQIRVKFNVASHSCLVYEIARSWDAPDYALVQALLHDLHEGVTRDVSSPLAHNPNMSYFRRICDGLLKANCERAGVPFPIHELVHRADKAACKLEAYAFAPDRHEDWEEWLDTYPDVEGFDPWDYLWNEEDSIENLLYRLQVATNGVGSREFHAEVDGWVKMALRDEIL